MPPSESHHAGFREEELFDVAIVGAQRFEDADFAPPLEDGHHQRIDNAQRGDGKREAAENSKQEIKYSKKQAKVARGVQQRKSGETHGLDRRFDRFDLLGTGHPHGKARVIAVHVRAIQHRAKIIYFCRAERLRDLQRDEDAAAAKAAETTTRLGGDNSDNFQLLLVRNHGKSAVARVRLFPRRRTGNSRARERLPLGITKHEVFANQRSGIVRKLLGEFNLQDRLVGGSGSKKTCPACLRTRHPNAPTPARRQPSSDTDYSRSGFPS